MKKYLHALFIVLFTAACLVPGAGLLINGPSQPAGNETAARAPSLTNPDGSFHVGFLSDAADWFSRSFGFRRELITLDAELKVGLFRTSPQSLVALGKGEWLYYAETLDDYTGADSITPRQAWCIARSLRLAQDYVQSKGAAFAFTIAPNKASVYPEYLPDSLRPAGTEYSAPAVEAILQQGVNYADLFAALRAQKAELEAEGGPCCDPLYFTTDSHWTNKGAALGHDVLLDSFGLPPEDAFGKPGAYQATHQGDLHEMLYPASGQLDLEFEFEQPLAFEYTRPIRGVDDLRIETASTSENGPLLMFRDSFGNALHSLMAESFSSARFVRATPYNMEQIEEMNAAYVVVEIVERNLPLLADASFLMPAPKLAELPWNDEELYRPESLSQAPAQLKEVSVNGNYTTLSGTVDAPCDPDSPVYLVLISDPSAVWEAFPQWDAEAGQTAFTAHFSQEDSIAFDLELVNREMNVVYRCNGQWMLALSDSVYRNPEYLADRGLWVGEE